MPGSVHAVVRPRYGQIRITGYAPATPPVASAYPRGRPSICILDAIMVLQTGCIGATIGRLHANK